MQLASVALLFGVYTSAHLGGLATRQVIVGLEQKRKRLELEEKQQSARQKALAKELEWIRMSPKARQSKGQARVSAYEKLLSQETEARREDLEIYIPPGPHLGDRPRIPARPPGGCAHAPGGAPAWPGCASAPP